MSPDSVPATTDEIVTATRTWLERAVIGLNLCPFAKAVHVQNRIRYCVSQAQSSTELLEDLTRELHALHAADPNERETTLLIHPAVLTDFIEYSLFLRSAEAKLSKLGYAAAFQLASFHPQYQFADAGPDDIENYTNRSPYPMLHLLRESSIARAVAAFPDAADIYEKNMESLRQLGHAGWQRLWQDDR